MSSGHTCSWGGDTWKVPTLWVAAEGLPVQVVPLAVFEDHLDRGVTQVWDLDDLHDFLEHVERLLAADLSYPILLAPDGRVLDGYHRLLKARREGREAILVKQFAVLPEPDETV